MMTSYKKDLRGFRDLEGLAVWRRALLYRPPAVISDHRVDLPHNADRLVQRDHHALVMLDVLG
jgi:hypothetical protein